MQQFFVKCPWLVWFSLLYSLVGLLLLLLFVGLAFCVRVCVQGSVFRKMFYVHSRVVCK